jgi:Holliday junction DNA helicase RuvA
MLSRISGNLESISADAVPAATIALPGELAVEILLPAYLGESLGSSIGQRVVLHTLVYLEAQGQGTSFIPRVVGFPSVRDRAFFEVFTTAKGVGNKKALKAMIEQPTAIAAAIVTKDIKALTKLPEIGKRLAETMVAQLSGKVEAFAGDAIMAPTSGSVIVEPRAMSGAADEAIAALMALGETRSEAERKVGLVLSKVGADPDVDEIVSAVFAGRTG